MQFLRTVYDDYNDEEIVLTKDEMRMINRIRMGEGGGWGCGARRQPTPPAVQAATVVPHSGVPACLPRSPLPPPAQSANLAGKFPHLEVDPFPEENHWFTKDVEVMPLTAAPEPKRRFTPSKWEEKK